MIYRKINGTELNASAICLGGVAFSRPEPAEAVFSVLDRFTDLGGNIIDTANIYGKWLPGGKNVSEQKIGMWMKSRNNRHKVLISSKGGHPHFASMNIPRLSKKEVAADLDESLSALQTDYIDIYWLHRDDPKMPASEMIDYLNDFVREGKIRYFGCSNWKPERIEEALAYSSSHNIQGFCGNQLMWSLAEPNPGTYRDMVPMDKRTYQLHLQTGLCAFAYMSIANGFFSKLARGGADALSEGVRKMYYNDRNIEKYDRILKIAEALHMSPSAVCVSYLMSQPFTTIPLAGCHTKEQLEDIMKAGDVMMESGTIEYLACEH